MNEWEVRKEGKKHGGKGRINREFAIGELIVSIK